MNEYGLHYYSNLMCTILRLYRILTRQKQLLFFYNPFLLFFFRYCGGDYITVYVAEVFYSYCVMEKKRISLNRGLHNLSIH